MNDETVAVIGLGNIGITVVVDLLFHGLHVVAIDSDAGVRGSVAESIEAPLTYAPALDKSLPRVKLAEALERLEVTEDLSRVAGCGIVVENIPEHFDTKRALYGQLGAHLHPGTLVAANTSCIAITRLASLLPGPSRVVGMHFMNPSYLTKAIEVVRGMHTNEEAVQRAGALVERLGKEMILVEDLPGFASNRVSHLFMNEAAWVVHDGVATAEAVDALFKKGFGHRMGPLETADLIGLDTVVNTLDALAEAYGDPKFRCCPLLRKMVHAGLHGRKSGRGFHTY